VWTVAITVSALAVLTTVLAVLVHQTEPFLRAVLIQGLQTRFHTRVELDEFHVRIGNGLHGEWGVWASGKGLRIWPPQRAGGDHPLEVAVQSIPLIELQEFGFHAPLSYKSDKPIRISLVRLSGLEIHVPPRSERDRESGFESAARAKSASAAATTPATQPATHPPGSTPTPAASAPDQPGSSMLSRIKVERIECDRAGLVLETDKPDKLPVQIGITHLRVMHISAYGPMDFEADVVNPKPAGVMHTTGQLGPWNADDPGLTTVTGTYRFPDADLSVFKGIAGILTSEGSYQGTLRDIGVNGQADVPNFRLTHFGNALPLHTKFQAHVDGTDGDTFLDHVDALLAQSHFVTSGKIVRVRRTETPEVQKVREAKGIPAPLFGHDIDLKVDVDRGRIEDFLRLAGNSPTPLLTGGLTLTASLQIPPGPDPVHHRIRLNGTFQLADTHFTNEKVRSRIRELSLRGQGHPDEVKSAQDLDVASQLQGEFHMANAVILFPDLQFDVPGAAIHLKGNYQLDGLMGFEGTARLQATVSQMVGGWKGFLLKPADRLFRKDGAGTEVAIEIKGPHDSPQFSVNLDHSKSTSPERPDQKQN
jgi:hypothetical protein